ncbi:MAG: hypothetical protein H6739_10535 [Alphaproteobacteria bacterium]|nr:hypothetical protein [Alphaproteobacteria bacterium]
MIALLLALSGPTHAAELGMYAGASWLANDPYLYRRGMQLGVEFAPNRILSVSTLHAFHPDLEEADWTPASMAFARNVYYVPAPSKLIARNELALRMTPVRWEGERFETRVGALAGVGWVRTRDDLNALQALGDPMAEATQFQRHPSQIIGLTGELRGEHAGVRLSASQVVYIEVINSVTLEMQHARFMSVEGTMWLF